MTNLLLAAGFLIGMGCWLVLASCRDARRLAGAQRARPGFGGRRMIVGVLVVAASGALVLRIARAQTLLWEVANSILGLTGIVLVLVVIGWAATWFSRRRLERDGAGAEPVVLEGRKLRLARVTWLAVFAALLILFVANLGGLWAEASRVRSGRVPHDEFLGDGWYSPSLEEWQLFGGSWSSGTLRVPLWYPWLNVVRQALVYAVVLGLAWFVFSRRPRQWMALFVSIFIPVLALATIGTGGTTRVDALWLPLGFVAGVLELLGLVAVGAFVWVFPDGRFRATYARLVGVLAVVGLPLGLLSGGSEFWEAVAWMFLMAMIAIIAAGGIATQVFRYRRASVDQRREARLILAALVVLLIWLTGGTSLNSVFPLPTWAGFVWRQIHLTLYVSTPVVLGLWILWLVRRQGWWDLDLFLNRTVVLAVAGPLLGVLYLGVVLVTGAAFSAWTGQSGSSLAVVAATMAVGFAYQPTRRRVQAAIDRRLFGQHAHAERVVGHFDRELSAEIDQDGVRTRLLDTVDAVFDPGVATLWLRTSSGGETG